MSENEIVLKLSKAEALVFFEWLARHDVADDFPVIHPAEEKVLWRLLGFLESTLVEPFAKNYNEIIAEARQSVESAPNC
jgi:hypothetical protein